MQESENHKTFNNYKNSYKIIERIYNEFNGTINADEVVSKEALQFASKKFKYNSDIYKNDEKTDSELEYYLYRDFKTFVGNTIQQVKEEYEKRKKLEDEINKKYEMKNQTNG